MNGLGRRAKGQSKCPPQRNAAGISVCRKTQGMQRRGRSPFDFSSAGGGMYVAEEHQNVASYIN